MNHLSYKTYQASVEYSSEDDLLVGRVLNVEALILFSASSVADLKTEFEAAIDGYLEDCAREGTEPEKSYKGTFNVRVGPDVHRQAARTAAQWNITLNELTRIALTQVVDRFATRPIATTVIATQNRFETLLYTKDTESQSLSYASPYKH